MARRSATGRDGPPILRRSSADPPRPRPPRPAGRRRFTDEELRAVFDSIDTSGDGEICVAELQVAIRTVAAKADDKTVERMLSFADADGDATVSFEEFKEIISASLTPKR